MQALILIDFLLSLTPRAKKKLAGKQNKSVLYSYTLADEDVCTIGRNVVLGVHIVDIISGRHNGHRR